MTVEGSIAAVSPSGGSVRQMTSGWLEAWPEGPDAGTESTVAMELQYAARRCRADLVAGYRVSGFHTDAVVPRLLERNVFELGPGWR